MHNTYMYVHVHYINLVSDYSDCFHYSLPTCISYWSILDFRVITGCVFFTGQRGMQPPGMYNVPPHMMMHQPHMQGVYICTRAGTKVEKQPSKLRQEKWTNLRRFAHVFINVALTLFGNIMPPKLDYCFIISTSLVPVTISTWI